LRVSASLREIKNSKRQIPKSKSRNHEITSLGGIKNSKTQIPNLKSRNPKIAPLRVSASLREIKIPKHKFQNPNQPGKVSK
jgi:hypothetical protein